MINSPEPPGVTIRLNPARYSNILFFNEMFTLIFLSRICCLIPLIIITRNALVKIKGKNSNLKSKTFAENFSKSEYAIKIK